MSNNEKSRAGGSRRSAFIALAIILLLLAGAGVVYAMTMKRDRGHGPKLLNQPTEARVVKPFTTKADKRFAPLPIEREKHGK